jgi:hypothetical protein
MTTTSNSYNQQRRIRKNKPADYNLEDTKIFSGKIIYGIFNVLLAEQVHDWITKEPSEAH